jgi:hypothetical protein
MAIALLWALLIGFLCMLLWAWPDLRAWMQARGDAVRCRVPEPHEQLHIVVVPRAGRFVAECMYVMPRGAAERAVKDAR